MNTKVFVLKKFKETGRISTEDEKMISEAADVIRSGGLVAFPTETVYGLGGDAFNKESTLKIYTAKGRPSDNPLIVHISDVSFLSSITNEIPSIARVLMDRFWPGPMTLILKRNVRFPKEISGGLDTVAVRYPSHPVANMLIAQAGVPIAAPSANLSGRPSTTSARDCVEDLRGKVDVIIDGGSSGIGLESTIIDVSGIDKATDDLSLINRPVLLRPGAITMEMIEEVLNLKMALDDALKGPLSKDTKPRAPGMKYRHYAPRARMVLISPKTQKDPEEASKKVAQQIPAIIQKIRQDYHKIALMVSSECLELLNVSSRDPKKETKVLMDPTPCLMDMGSVHDPEKMAHDVFNDLRECDRLGVDFIIAEGYPEKGLFLAIMNRLKKAAAWEIIEI